MIGRSATLAALAAALMPCAALAQTPRTADPPPETVSAPSGSPSAQPANQGARPIDPAVKRAPERGQQEPPAGDVGY